MSTRYKIIHNEKTDEVKMLIQFEGTPEEVRSQVAEFFGLSLGEAAPTPITAANGKSKAKAPAAKVDTTQAAAAGSPAPPSPAVPAASASQMMPLCSDHAAKVGPNIKAIPSEKSACVMCANDATAAKSSAPAGKSMTLDEVKAVADALMQSMKEGPNRCFDIIESLGAESLTGAQDTKALDPSKYEEFAKLCVAAMPAPAAAPARRAL